MDRAGFSFGDVLKGRGGHSLSEGYAGREVCNVALVELQENDQQTADIMAGIAQGEGGNCSVPAQGDRGVGDRMVLPQNMLYKLVLRSSAGISSETWSVTFALTMLTALEPSMEGAGSCSDVYPVQGHLAVTDRIVPSP